MSEICTDNRFEVIAAYKKKLMERTNIETSPDEMAVIDNVLFRFWQMGWLSPVPHGRLIDADALKNIVFESLKNAITDCNPTLFGKVLCTFIAESIVDEIEAALTIIPAEENE